MRMKSSWSGYCQCEVIEKLCRDASHVLGRGSCVGQSRSAGKVYIHCSESVEEKPLSGLVRINTEDFRFPKSGVYTSLQISLSPHAIDGLVKGLEANQRLVGDLTLATLEDS
uniref:Uncharacterized protein n=1 Tax=Oryza sativa subsp. japonica TaxID=39947 RepID=Q2R046_ORYSJ|nr:hypothetical protein LOC_Os11g43810 [Oryza sativa Japonica Group]